MVAVVTGAAGFAGYSLTYELAEKGYNVYAIVRPGSEHNSRLSGLNVKVIELDSSDYHKLPELIEETCDVFFHLAWSGGRDDFRGQEKNISQAISTVEVASELKCKRIIITGSQAEYGVQEGIITEEVLPAPINAYGAAKVAAMHLTKRRAEQLGIEWIWGRIFSLYGKYEPAGRMLPDLITKLKNAEEVNLSSCTQYWDYLNVKDAADALVSLAEQGNSGEIYNIANGGYRFLKKYVQEIVSIVSPDSSIHYGAPPKPFISLKPDVSKIMSHTGWKPSVDFSDGIRNMCKEMLT